MILIGRPLRTFAASPASAAANDWYLPLSRAPASWWEAARDGSDITVYAQDRATRLPCEIVAFNAAAKTGHLWIGRGTATAAYVECGSGRAAQAVTDPYGRNAVWEAGALGIWHLADMTDSTGKNTSTSTAEPAYTAANLPKSPALFNGTSQYINTGCSTDGLTAFTLMVYVNQAAVGDLFAMSSRNSGTTGGLFAFASASLMSFGFSNGVHMTYRRYGTADAGTPTLMFGVHAPGVADVTVYYNGVITPSSLIASSATNPANSGAPFILGKDGADTTPYWFKNNLGAVRLYNRALSSTEVAAIDNNYRNATTSFWTIGACF